MHPPDRKEEARFTALLAAKMEGYDELFWQALGDYTILALHRVKDVEYNLTRAKIRFSISPNLKEMQNLRKELEKLFRG